MKNTPKTLQEALQRLAAAEFMDRPEVAGLMALSESRISQLVREGLLEQAPDGRFPRIATVRTIVEHIRRRGDDAAQRSEERAAKIELLGIALQKARGEVFLVSDVQRAWADIVLRARDAFRRLGAKVSGQLLYCRSEIEMQKKIDDAADEILTELSRPVDYQQEQQR